MIQATLVTDGSSDVVLVPILEWLLAQITEESVHVQWADLRARRQPPRDLGQRLDLAVALYPCDILFVHRDAECADPGSRHREIRAANATGIGHVCVVPVRMQEAWLLHNEGALREAAGRPSGREPLDLPLQKNWERLPDPKVVLHDALRAASGASGRRAKRFNPAQAAHRLANLIDDWSPLRPLEAFRQLEDDTRAAISALQVSVRT